MSLFLEVVMAHRHASRRQFLKVAGTAASAALVPYVFTGQARGDNEKRPILGCIGTGSRWDAVGPSAMEFADCVAVCDVDSDHASKAAQRVKSLQSREVDVCSDYRQILDRKEIAVVTIVTPDHWHTRIAIEAMQAGKDVYCEKPLTLTIDEGKQIRQVLKETGRVFQVGTQQRSEMELRFLKAIALIRDGRIGDVQKVHVAIGGADASGPLPVAPVPATLNWEMWLGQAPLVDYRYKEGGTWGKSRCHYEFRWWYEYSGGKLTDWGAHHVDIGQWGIDQLGEGQGPIRVEPLMAEHPVPMMNGMPTMDDQYNCATKFNIKVTYPGDVEMFIRHTWMDDPDLNFDNGIMFTGTKGRLFVSRSRMSGSAVDELKDRPLPEAAIARLYNGKMPAAKNAHMRNFFDCVESRQLPISDVFTHHRAMTTCHLANIAIRLDRALAWDPKTEQIVGDEDANAWQRRTPRKGYEITV